jgi:hypothetical protein
MLSAEEMVSLKSHIMACPSCQEILATLEVTEAIPLEARDTDKTFSRKANVALRAVQGSQVLSSVSGEEAPTARRSIVREMPKPKSYVRWAAPAGAIAAGLLIWIAMSESWKAQKMAKPASVPVEVAENPQAKQPQPEPGVAEMVRVPNSQAEEKTQHADNELDKQIAGLRAIDKDGQSLSRSRVNRNAAPQHGPAMMQNQVQNQIQNNGNVNQSQDAFVFNAPAGSPQLTSPRPNLPAKSAAKSQVAVAVPPPPAPAPSATGGIGGNAVGGERKDQKVSSATGKAEVAAEAGAVADAKNVSGDSTTKLSANARSIEETRKFEGGVAADASTTARKEKQAAEAGRAQLKKSDTAIMSDAMTSASLRDSDEFQLSVLRTTNAKVFWVISREGEVFRSEDGGKSSRKQEIPLGIKAITGSAPDAKVCWILAEKGVAVRTADGGEHWASFAVPANSALTKITARDAMHAVISDVSGKIGYSTADGGASWNLVAQ